MTNKQLATIEMVRILTAFGLPHYVTEDGHAIIHWWDFETAPRPQVEVAVSAVAEVTDGL
jgi:hypothetical protein